MPRSALHSTNQPGGMFAIEDMSRSTGNRFYVHHSGSTSTSAGRNPDVPISTIDAAIGLCTANQGDIIYVMPGHAESVIAAAGIACDVAGVSIIGLGNGENRPVVTLSTADTATVTVSAANVLIKNIVFKAAVDSLAVVIPVTGAGATIEDCEFLEGSSIQYLIGVNLGTGSDRATVRRCYFKSVAVGANSAIKIAAAVDRVSIIGCEVFGDFADACVHNPTGNVATRLRIDDNVLTNLQSGDHAIELVSACTGVINRNIVNSTLAAAGGATSIDGGSCFMNLNYGVDATADVQGILNPVADS